MPCGQEAAERDHYASCPGCHRCSPLKYPAPNPLPQETLKDEKIQRLTQFLCYLVTQVRKGHPLSFILASNPPLQAWVEAHDLQDKARLKIQYSDELTQEARRTAAQKLTHTERLALGLNDLAP